MRVQLIMPRKEKKRITAFGVYAAPLSLLQLAALTPPNIELKLGDENLEDTDFDWKPDLVGLSVMTSQADRADEISRRFKEKGAKVVWGGFHPTFVDQTQNSAIDSFVVGEAEEAWPRLLKDFEAGMMQKKYQGRPADLNAIPLPRRDFLRPKDVGIVEMIMASRGCYFSCSYCAANIYGGVRWKNPRRLEQELATIESQACAFGDSNMALPKAYVKQLLETAKKFRKSWFAQVDPKSSLDSEIAKIFSEAGIKLVLVGFESVNPENFAGNSKYLHPERWKEVVDNFHKYGILVNGDFMLGFDYDKEDVFERTRKAVQQIRLDCACFGILTPYPGTQIADELKPRIFDKRWGNYDTNHVVFTPKNISPEQLEAGTKELRTMFIPVYSILKDALIGR